jgi:hypothetical protein
LSRLELVEVQSRHGRAPLKLAACPPRSPA